MFYCLFLSFIDLNNSYFSFEDSYFNDEFSVNESYWEQEVVDDEWEFALPFTKMLEEEEDDDDGKAKTLVRKSRKL